MRFKVFGRTGLRVSELCLGTMTFGTAWGWGAEKDECAQILEAFGEAGGNFVDTANLYTAGESERVLGELIAADRDHWVLATKYTLNTRSGDPNAGGAHRKSLVQALEASLDRLGTSYIDVYWVHIWDAFTPIDEVMRALDDVVRAGKVLYVGISDTPAWIVSRAVTLAEERGWTPFSGIQLPYNLVERSAERDLLPMANMLDLAVTAWEPLAGGLLSGRYGTDREPPTDTRITTTGYASRLLSDRNLRIADVVNAIAAERSASSAQVAVAWLRAQNRRAQVIPIVGARRRSQIEDTLGAAELDLSSEELERLDAVSAIELGFPHDFQGREYAYGGTFDLIDQHRPLLYTEVTKP
jgi:aryl-alcohol dehydrogenase-like predicted oxidoreductase